MPGAVYEIEGLREFQKNLAKIHKGAAKAVRDGIREAAKPVALRVEQRALGEIRNMGPPWHQIRIGAPAGQVYLVPKTRNRGGSKRPNLSRLLLNEAMLPGVGDKREEFLKAVGKHFERLTDSAGF